MARAFTGWTLLPPGADRRRAQQRLARVARMGGLGARPANAGRTARKPSRLGFEINGEFLFRADLHDAGAKTVLGKSFPAGGGVEEGRQVLDLLARHPSTARHLARKLAVRFVADDHARPARGAAARVKPRPEAPVSGLTSVGQTAWRRWAMQTWQVRLG